MNRLRQTWEKLPTKYNKLFSDLQDLMDPSRNMSKYRQLVASVANSPPLVSTSGAIALKRRFPKKKSPTYINTLMSTFQIPFYPVVKKDFTFIHLGNDSIIDGLINFEKLRMIAKEVRKLSDMCSSSYDLMLGDPATQVALGQIPTINSISHGISTVKRRKKSSGALNQRKMYEEVSTLGSKRWVVGTRAA